MLSNKYILEKVATLLQAEKKNKVKSHEDFK